MARFTSLTGTLRSTECIGRGPFTSRRLNEGEALLVVFFGSDLHAHLDARGTTVGLNVGIVILSIGRKT